MYLSRSKDDVDRKSKSPIKTRGCSITNKTKVDTLQYLNTAAMGNPPFIDVFHHQNHHLSRMSQRSSVRFGRGHRPCGSADPGNSGTTRLQSVDRGTSPTKINTPQTFSKK